MQLLLLQFKASAQKSWALTPDAFIMVAYHNNSIHHTFLRNSNMKLEGDRPLPFPTRAAMKLSEERSTRYDEVEGAIEEAELRIREYASMMGLIAIHDDPANAA